MDTNENTKAEMTESLALVAMRAVKGWVAERLTTSQGREQLLEAEQRLIAILKREIRPL